ncbi:hypothetical protein [Chryseobacterium sp. MEBOG07]|uniref:hypothetical protein n=1 Tax=Chryseobacterium sp. MEBOG07 TaxID=2879939 RepID=UPI001F1885E4|nr:hypothetical protein [Chryseobacterium sp. MEBOG07]UKB79552.1 hypothetical protein LF886_00665 [Chryseobacterium sp. MEBOG07]
MNNILNVQEGAKVLYKGLECKIFRVIDIKRISIQEIATDIIHTVRLEEISLPLSNKQNVRDFIDFTKEEWDKVQFRYDIISPILNNKGDSKLILRKAKEANVHRSTLYRWINWFESTGQKYPLLGDRKTGGKGKSRLNKEQEEIIKESIEEVYLNPLRKSIYAVIIDISRKCREREVPPRMNQLFVEEYKLFQKRKL